MVRSCSQAVGTVTAAAPATSGSAQLQLLVNAARYCQTGDTGPIRPRLDPHAGLSVLDGRHRLRACEETGTPLKTEILDPSIDPFDYVLDANLHRRHLSEHAKVQVVQMVAKLRPHGGDHRGDDFKLAGRQLEITREQVSQQAGVNQAVVDRVRKIAQAPEPIRMASLRGDITLTDAVACIPFVAQVGRAWQRADPAPSRNPPVSRAALGGSGGKGLGGALFPQEPTSRWQAIAWPPRLYEHVALMNKYPAGA